MEPTALPQAAAAAAVDSVSPEEIVESWRAVCVPRGAPDIIELSPQRRLKLRARIRDHPAFEFWDGVFHKMAASPFLFGNGNRGWKADFDWLIENDTHVLRIVEGKYLEARQEKAPAWNRR